MMATVSPLCLECTLKVCPRGTITQCSNFNTAEQNNTLVLLPNEFPYIGESSVVHNKLPGSVEILSYTCYCTKQ